MVEVSNVEMERLIPVSKEDLTRVFADDNTVTYEFHHAATVTLVAEKNRSKWEQHDRAEKAGDVFFLTDELADRIQHSKTGVPVGENVRLIREASAHPDAIWGDSDA